ncbi:MAG: radical SAM protein [Candidatus Brockarchaeota archaeon]|nr:radical SAM protein [Candidatus Brockarchaeota archaeon]
MWFLRSDAATVWKDEEVQKRLSWYRAVMKGSKPAKFLIAKSIPTRIGTSSLRNMHEEELWNLHEELVVKFRDAYESVKNGEVSNLVSLESSFLDVKIALSEKLVEHCEFCERRCRVNRKEGKLGFCRVRYESRVSTWFHHFGEEAPLIGEGGSGTIFFAGCNFGPCVFCQNWDISSDPENGGEVNPRTLALISKSLKMEKAANINYVGGDPTPNLHTILASLKYLDVNVPQLWNSNMYCSTETMKLLAELIDIWLPDFKYGNNDCAKRLSRVENYFETVSRNHRIASENGDMIIRHLVLPNHLDCCTKPVLKWISENTPRALVNIMGQYHPDYLVARNPGMYPDISRRPSSSEMQEAYDYARKLKIVFEPVS